MAQFGFLPIKELATLNKRYFSDYVTKVIAGDLANKLKVRVRDSESGTITVRFDELMRDLPLTYINYMNEADIGDAVRSTHFIDSVTELGYQMCITHDSIQLSFDVSIEINEYLTSQAQSNQSA